MKSEQYNHMTDYCPVPRSVRELRHEYPIIPSIYLEIADHANHDYVPHDFRPSPSVDGYSLYTLSHGQAVLSIGTITESIGAVKVGKKTARISEKTVKKYLDMMEEAGAIIAEKLPTGTRYTLTIEATEPVKAEARKNRKQIEENRKQIEECRKQKQPAYVKPWDGVTGYEFLGKDDGTTGMEPRDGTTERPLFYADSSDSWNHGMEPRERHHNLDNDYSQEMLCHGSVDNSLDPLEVIHTEEAGAEFSTSDRATTEAEQPQERELTVEEMLKEETRTLDGVTRIAVEIQVHKAEKAKLKVDRDAIKNFVRIEKQKRGIS